LHSLSIPQIVMASINFYVGIYYLILYSKKPQIKEHLPFAFLCVSAGLYNIFSLGLYNSLSIEQGVFWQRLQLNMGGIISMFFIWFITVFTEQKSRLIFKLTVAWYLVILLASFLVNPELSLTASRPAIKHINFLDISAITYYEGEAGLVYLLEMVSMGVLYVYLLILALRYYRKSRSRVFLTVIISLFIFFFGVTNDILVGLQVYSFIYLSEYMYFFIIMAMAYTLLSKFVSVQTAFEELNSTLELKVQERTNALKESQDKSIQSAKMAAVGTLASGVAHEINNPLTVILGFAQFLMKQVKKDSLFYAPLEAIERESERCKKLVQSLLIYSRASKFNKEIININKSIEDSLLLIEVRTKINNITIERDLEQNLPEIIVDNNQIQQIIINLCNNAADAMPQGGIIRVGSRQKTEYLEIIISDTGTGIPKENIDKIFNPFFTTKEVGKGTGLGLSLCYEIIQKHKGNITVKSETGKGTSFTIMLPLKQEPL